MTFDYGSVLLAVGASGAALSFTLFTNWLRQRGSGFLRTWALAMAVIVMSVASFAVFNLTLDPSLAAIAAVLLVWGIVINYGGMVEFRDGKLPVRRLIIIALAFSAPAAIAFVAGYGGAGFWIVNSISAALIFYCAVGYWRMRSESPAALTTVGGLHFILAVTFALCAIVGFGEAPLYLEGRGPDNWAEVLNLVASVIALTGIGGLLVTVYQERIARHHEQNALTDPLTGLKNRRALYEMLDSENVPENTAIIVLDLDAFKALNDTYGHALGDTVLQRFAAILTDVISEDGIAVRLGGEEFVLVLTESSVSEAMAVAERVRLSMARMVLDVEGGEIRCTVSAGIAIADKPGRSLDGLMRKADNTLYLSKRNGRNRVTAPSRSAA